MFFSKLKLSTSVWNWISWNLTKFQLIQLIQTIVIFILFYGLSDWVEILWGFTKFFFKQILKVSAFYLEIQKSFIPKKKFLSRCQYQNKKALFTDPIFSEGFDYTHKKNSFLHYARVQFRLRDHNLTYLVPGLNSGNLFYNPPKEAPFYKLTLHNGAKDCL